MHSAAPVHLVLLLLLATCAYSRVIQSPTLPPHLSRNQQPLSSEYPSADRLRFPGELSLLASAVYQNVTQSLLQSGTYSNSPTPLDLLGTSGRLTHLVSGHGDTSLFADEVIIPAITSAQVEVLLTTFIFDRDTPASDAVGRAIRELDREAGERGKRVRVYLAIDTIGATTFSGEMPQFKSLFSSVTEISGKHYRLPLAEDVPNLDYQVKNVHKRLLGALHSKMILIDGRTSVLGSKNLDGDSAFEWMFTMEGAITRSMRSDFEDLWDEKLPTLPAGTFYGPRPGVDVPVLVLSRVQSPNLWTTHRQNPQNIGWLAAMANAQRDIYIQTPNFTVDFAAEAVLEAVRRGISVTIITSYSLSDSEQKIYKHNISHNRGTAKWMYEQLKKEPEAASLLKVCWFISADREDTDPQPTAGDWSHVKFMAVDTEIAILGSGNMDAQSGYRSRENNVLIDHAPTTRQLMEELLAKHQSFKNCHRD